MDTDIIEQKNLSAEAAKNIDNDRCAHLSFQHDATRGVAMGCGYGACDPEMTTVASVSPGETSSVSKTDNTPLVLHGFLGTFHSALYESKDGKRSSVISIAPASFSVGMFSWFPLYFPLKEPLRVPPGAYVNCSIWRRSDRERVWYEWCAEVVSSEDIEEVVLSTGCVHNPGGRSYHVRL
jgi:protein arginine N-methyltransferase 5